MPIAVNKNFHLPLPSALYADLRAAAERAGTPATEVAREAIQSWLREARRRKIREELRAYAEQVAGTTEDFDPAASAAGAESFLNAYPDDDWSGEPGYPGAKSAPARKSAPRAASAKRPHRAKA